MIKKSQLSGFAQRADKIIGALRNGRRFLPLGLAFGLPQLLRAENHVDYRYEFYGEENDRMKIETHSVYFEQKLSDAVVAKGELIYDGISGATPRGVTDPNVVDHLRDTRWAGNVALDWSFKNHLLTPSFAYSKENDYESYSISLNDAISFNDKNTTFQYGLAHNFDSVRFTDGKNWLGKDTTEGMIGISQLLTPSTVMSANLTLGYEDGYLSDPYRLSQFTTFGFAFNEKRPGYKSKEVALVSVTQYFEKLHASIEGSYRFHHDSFDVSSHTAELTWHQWLGKHVILEPMFRYYNQSEADFYAVNFPGITPSGGNYFSSDYRLSNLYSLDYGLQATFIVTDWLRLNAGYHRYEMFGLDGKTADGMYPKANIFTVGFSIQW
jgi:hypothetical protein